MVSALVSCSAALESSTEVGRLTALHLAAVMGKSTTAIVLLKVMPSAPAVTLQQQMYAVIVCFPLVTNLVVHYCNSQWPQARASATVSSAAGCTASMLAARNEHLQLRELLRVAQVSYLHVE